MDRPSAPDGVLPRLGLALLISLLAGVLVASLVAPVLVGAGLAVKSSTDDFLALPSELDTPALATRSEVLAVDGSLLATFYRVNRVAAPLEAIPVALRQAVVAIEDSRFYEHDGVDYKGTARAAITNLRRGGVAQGGSTLTQQYVKNALLESATDKAGQDAARAATADRKLQEARYALALEERLTKDEILQRYLDIAYFGNGVYGVGTAATYYFGRPVEQLTLPESALLAGVVQNPTRFDVASKDPEVQAGLVDRRDTVLGRMRDLGHITEQERAQAAATPLTDVDPVEVGQDCSGSEVVAPFFCDYLRRELEDTPVGAALGATREERQNKLFAGGLTIRTSLDPQIQASAQQAVDEQVPNGDPSGVGAVADVVEPGTGAIRAMAVDRPYGDDAARGATKVNLATGATQGFQPGSTFKAFFLAAALQQGIPLSTTIYAPAAYRPEGRNGCPRTYEGKPTEFVNAETDEAGAFDLRTATHLSVNTYYMQLAERTGLEKPLALAEAMGVKNVADGGRGQAPLERVCSSPLGVGGVSPLAMAGAYATFAAHGLHCTPRAVLGLTGPDGQELPVPEPDCAQVLEPAVADTVTSVLTGVVDGGNPRRTGAGASLGRPVAGKTGTTNESTAAWFVGYTPQLATSVWVGHLPNPQQMRNIRINDRTYRQVFGGTLPAAIWRQAMTGALQGVPVQGFTTPDPASSRGAAPDVRGRVPDVSGRPYDEAAAALSAAGYSPRRGRPVDSRFTAGTVAYTSPRGGRPAAPGTAVDVHASTGRRTGSVVGPGLPLTVRPTVPAPRTTASQAPRTPAPTSSLRTTPGTAATDATDAGTAADTTAPARRSTTQAPLQAPDARPTATPSP